MGQMIYIPPQKGAIKARPAVQPAGVPPDLVMNNLQFVNTLKGTHHEVYSTLIKNELKMFHGTNAEWFAKLEELKAVPA